MAVVELVGGCEKAVRETGRVYFGESVLAIKAFGVSENNGKSGKTNTRKSRDITVSESRESNESSESSELIHLKGFFQNVLDFSLLVL